MKKRKSNLIFKARNTKTKYVEMYKSSRDRDRKGSNIQKDKRYTDMEGSCPKWHLGFLKGQKI